MERTEGGKKQRRKMRRTEAEVNKRLSSVERARRNWGFGFANVEPEEQQKKRRKKKIEVDSRVWVKSWPSARKW
jgi:hypothetical protein